MYEQNGVSDLDYQATAKALLSTAVLDVEQTLMQAISYHHAGHTTEAERLYQMVLALCSDQPAASYGLGLIFAAQGRLHEAADAYRQAIAVRPDFVDAYINLGTTVLALGRCGEAEALYRHALTINP